MPSKGERREMTTDSAGSTGTGETIHSTYFVHIGQIDQRASKHSKA